MMINSMLTASSAAGSLNLGESFGISLFGFSIVFVVLIGLSALIFIQSKLLSKSKKTEGEGFEAAKAAAPAAVLDKASAGNKLKLINVDDKTAAIIMAIVCDELKQSPSELTFSYIKLIENA